MSFITIDLPVPANSEFFNSRTINYFLPEICAISEFQELTPDFAQSNSRYVFKIYLTYGLDVEFGFRTGQEGRAARKDLINCLSNYWGPDIMVFSNGYDYDVTVIPAIQSVTDVYTKDSRSSFSIVVDSMPRPVNMIFVDELEANSQHRNLCEAIETHRRQGCQYDAKVMICG